MKKYIEVVTSDISGEGGAETVVIPEFDIDLTPAEKANLLKTLEPYLRAGRVRVGRRGQAAPGVATRARDARSRALTGERREAREWLRVNGYAVGVTGTIKQEHWDAWLSRTPNPEQSQPAAPAHSNGHRAAAEVYVAKTVKPSRRTRAQMSPAFQAAEEAAGIGPTRPILPPAEQVRNRSAAEAVATPVKLPGKAAAPRKTSALKAGASVVPSQLQRAAKAAPVKTAAASKAAPRKAAATAKVTRAK